AVCGCRWRWRLWPPAPLPIATCPCTSWPVSCATPATVSPRSPPPTTHTPTCGQCSLGPTTPCPPTRPGCFASSASTPPRSPPRRRGPPPAAPSLAGPPPPGVRPLPPELPRAGRLVEHVPGRSTFHDLLRAYAADLARTADTDDDRQAAIHRILDHYLHTAHAADRLLARDPITLTPPQPGVTPEHLVDHEQAVTWFIAEHAVLLAAVDHAAATGFDTH